MSENEIVEVLSKYRVVAVVGLSSTVGKPSHRVSAYLKQHGYCIVPINPNVEEVLGLKSYKSLLDVPEEIQKTIEIVDVFRKPQDVLAVVEQVVELKKRFGNPFVVWMQQDIVNDEAAKLARDAGLVVVMDRCLMVEHQRLFG